MEHYRSDFSLEKESILAGCQEIKIKDFAQALEWYYAEDEKRFKHLLWTYDYYTFVIEINPISLYRSRKEKGIVAYFNSSRHLISDETVCKLYFAFSEKYNL